MSDRTPMNQSTRKSVLPVAFLAVALLAPSVVPTEGNGHGIFALMRFFFMSLLFFSVPALLFRFRLVRILLFLLALLVPIEVYYRLYYSGPMSPGVLSCIQETNWHEAWEYMKSYPSFTAAGLAYLAGLILVCFRAIKGGNPLKWQLVITIVVIAGTFIFADLAVKHQRHHRLLYSVDYLKETVKASFPMDIGYSFQINFRGHIETSRLAATRAKFAFQNVARETKPIGPEVYVVIIGETGRRANWSLYGYARETNPELRKLRQKLFVFTDVVSNATITIYSIPLALTRATPSEWSRSQSEKSIITLAKQAGFDTYWISNQVRYGRNENPVSAIALEADHVLFTRETALSRMPDPYDSNLVTRLDELLQSQHANSRSAIFLHCLGSHFEYRDRYPPEFDKFTMPDQQLGGTFDLTVAQRKLVGEYDNSILYTDYIISQVIKLLSKRGSIAAVVYFSDHGERLYEGGPLTEAVGHGFRNPAKEEVEIPFLVWLSNSYQQKFARKAAALRNNLGKPASLNDLFETVGDMLSIRYQGQDLSRSLFSAQRQAPAERELLTVDQTVVRYPQLR